MGRKERGSGEDGPERRHFRRRIGDGAGWNLPLGRKKRGRRGDGTERRRIGEGAGSKLPLGREKRGKRGDGPERWYPGSRIGEGAGWKLPLGREESGRRRNGVEGGSHDAIVCVAVLDGHVDARVGRCLYIL